MLMRTVLTRNEYQPKNKLLFWQTSLVTMITGGKTTPLPPEQHTKSELSRKLSGTDRMLNVSLGTLLQVLKKL
jgi:hypothetical protein